MLHLKDWVKHESKQDITNKHSRWYGRIVRQANVKVTEHSHLETSSTLCTELLTLSGLVGSETNVKCRTFSVQVKFVLE